MSKTIFVIAGGPVGDPAFFSERWEHCGRPPLICADGGARHLYPLNLVPELIIGDMDSLDPALQDHFTRAGSRILRYPTDKDETDTQLALEYACQSGPEEIQVYGATGSRIDHTLSNIFLLTMGIDRDIRTLLVDAWCEIFLVRGSYEIQGEAGQTVSIFPFGDRAEGITLDGFAFPLRGATMEIGRPLGISNRLVGDMGRISVARGTLLVIRYGKAGLPEGDQS